VYTKRLTGDARGLKIGVVREGFGWPNSERDVDEMVKAAAQKLTRAGATVAEVSVPLHRDGPHIWNAIAVEAAWLWRLSLARRVAVGRSPNRASATDFGTKLAKPCPGQPKQAVASQPATHQSPTLDRGGADYDPESRLEKQFLVDELTVGMFVCALDRPWLDTPFLIQGFLIEDEETLAQVRQICRYVSVDLSRSGIDDAEYLALRPARVEAKRVRGTAPSPPTDQRAQPRSLVPRWLQALFWIFGPNWRQPEEQPPPAHLPEKDLRPAPVDRVKRAAVPKRKAPSATALERNPPGIALAAPGDLLAWLGEQLERLRFSGGRESSATADAPGSAGAPRLKRSASGRLNYESVPLEQELLRANDRFGAAIDMLGTVMHDIQVGKGLEIEAVESVVEDLVESIIRHPGALQLVSRMREADESSYTHALQVGVLLVSFGRELGFSRDELTHLGQVGMLLDIGKLRIDQRILNKRTHLTPKEFDEVKRHVEYGLEIIEASAVAHPDVVTGVAQHHERLNGSGYPQGLQDPEISPIGKMAGIVDTFSALTSIRPYAEPVSPYAAMQQLQAWADTYFNSGLVELFIQAIGIFPVGTLVELSTGELAVVLEQSRPRRLKPKVLVISAPDKTPLEIPFVLDLLHPECDSADRVPYIRQGLAAASFAVDPREYYVSRS
jgi:HD-GYP domain-containing protein (c-di-GMP phosphodiesterase class II)